MTCLHTLRTERILLRQWHNGDLPAFAQLNSDAEVMRHFPSPLSADESNAMAMRCQRLIEQRGWGFWAAEHLATGQFMGFIGLHVPAANLPFSPCVEIGWRLARPFWGQGLATEGARAALALAWQNLALPEVVSFTTLCNLRSQRVMHKLGMQRDARTFEHPALPVGHPLREHVLYRLQAPDHNLAPN